MLRQQQGEFMPLKTQQHLPGRRPCRGDLGLGAVTYKSAGSPLAPLAFQAIGQEYGEWVGEQRQAGDFKGAWRRVTKWPAAILSSGRRPRSNCRPPTWRGVKHCAQLATMARRPRCTTRWQTVGPYFSSRPAWRGAGDARLGVVLASQGRMQSPRASTERCFSVSMTTSPTGGIGRGSRRQTGICAGVDGGGCAGPSAAMRTGRAIRPTGCEHQAGPACTQRIGRQYSVQLVRGERDAPSALP